MLKRLHHRHDHDHDQEDGRYLVNHPEESFISRTLVFGEEGEGGGPGYATFLRKTDGSPAIRLGTGEGLALSADGRWVIAQKQESPSQLVLMPTGAGAVRVLTKDDITHTDARFLPASPRRSRPRASRESLSRLTGRRFWCERRMERDR